MELELKEFNEFCLWGKIQFFVKQFLLSNKDYEKAMELTIKNYKKQVIKNKDNNFIDTKTSFSSFIYEEIEEKKKSNEIERKNRIKISFEEIIDYLESLFSSSMLKENEMIVREYILWIGIFNDYKKKLPSFNSYITSLSYKNALFKLNKSINDIRERISNVRLRQDNMIFLMKMKDSIKKISKVESYCHIRK